MVGRATTGPVATTLSPSGPASQRRGTALPIIPNAPPASSLLRRLDASVTVQTVLWLAGSLLAFAWLGTIAAVIVFALAAITASVRLDQRRRQAAQEHTWFDAIERCMTTGLIVVGQDGLVSSCNPAAIRLMDVSADDAVGIPATQLFGAFTDISGTTRLHQAMRRVLAAEGAMSVDEVVTCARQQRDIAATLFAIECSSQARRVGMLIRDVTRERELDRRRESFACVASHELRTPLTKVQGYAELLLSRDSVPQATQRQWLNVISQNAQRLTAIVDDLLSVSRIQNGTVALHLRPVSIAEAIEDAVSQARTTTHAHRFSVDVEAGLWPVNTDPDKLAHVLGNLIDNAIKYSPDGGLVEVKARYAVNPLRILVTVRDEGIGIEADDQKELFTTFFRVQRDDTMAVRGSGVGLFVARSLVHLWGGDLWVESQPNQGSTFSFTIPVPEA